MLESAYRTLESGRDLPPGLYNRLRSYAVSHRDDPRAFLLLARYNLRRGHLTDAVGSYQRAFEIDETSRHDPRMLPDLVSMVKSNSVGYRASRAVLRIYGREALSDVEQALAEPDLDARARSRLERLRDALRNER
jgi:hypothetical protein